MVYSHEKGWLTCRVNREGIRAVSSSNESIAVVCSEALVNVFIPSKPVMSDCIVRRRKGSSSFTSSVEANRFVVTFS
jgi:hypothetical protein